jgi:hypothetical protein
MKLDRRKRQSRFSSSLACLKKRETSTQTERIIAGFYLLVKIGDLLFGQAAVRNWPGRRAEHWSDFVA